MVEIIGTIGPGTKTAAVYVPGTGTNLDGSGTNHDAAWNLADLTEGPVILYMGGDLPQDLLPWPPLSDNHAFDTTPATNMAPGLVGFGYELDRTLDAVAPDAKTTFIGHSYGGAIVGTAEQLGLNADRVIYASSAGTGVLDGPWQNPNPNVERYSLTAPGDPVHFSQSFGGSQHGGDPDTTPGVTRLDTGYYDEGNRDYPGELVRGSKGHGEYWNDPNSDAFQNIVKVVTGGQPTEYIDRAPDTVIDSAREGVGKAWPSPHDILTPLRGLF